MSFEIQTTKNGDVFDWGEAETPEAAILCAITLIRDDQEATANSTRGSRYGARFYGPDGALSYVASYADLLLVAP